MPKMKISIPAVGIDLGHANVKVAFGAVGRPHQLVFPALAVHINTRDGAMSFDGSMRADGVEVIVDGQRYFVGKDASRYADTLSGRPSQERYVHTQEYEALMLGAIAHVLAIKNISAGSEVQIQCVGLGLPLSTYLDEQETLKQRWKGAFTVPVQGGCAAVEVQEVSVMPQPVGALFAFAEQSGDEALVEEINRHPTLILDVGGGTFDFLTTAGGVMLNPKRSGATSHGMTRCAEAVARDFGGAKASAWQTNPNVMNEIDGAISRGHDISLPGQSIARADYLRSVLTVVDAGLTSAEKRIQTFDDIWLILCVGGGGRLYADRFAKRFSDVRATIRCDEQPLFTNVKGFHIHANRKAESLARARCERVAA